MATYNWNNRPAHKFETCAVSDFGSWKRDALLFDKIYVSKYTQEQQRPPIEITFNIEDYEDLTATIENQTAAAAGYIENPDVLLNAMYGTTTPDTIRVVTKRSIANECSRRNIDARPTYLNNVLFYSEFSEGVKVAYNAAINNLPIINDSKTTWDHIVAFREDHESVRKYRALRHFLHHSLKASSVQEATEIIEKMIDDYTWAVNKHGMETKIGALSQILDWKQTSLMAGSAAALGVVGGPVVAALSTSILTLANTVVYLKKRSIDLGDITRGPNSEIAILYEAQKEFGG